MLNLLSLLSKENIWLYKQTLNKSEESNEIMMHNDDDVMMMHDDDDDII